MSGERPASAGRDASGNFRRGTKDAGDGAVAGTNKVAFTGAEPRVTEDATASVVDDPSKLPKPPMSIPSKYANPETFGVVIEVPPSGSPDLEVELE